MAKQARTKIAEVEIEWIEDGEVVKREFIERKLFFHGARLGWYFNDMSGKKHFLTRQEPPMVQNVIAKEKKS